MADRQGKRPAEGGEKTKSRKSRCPYSGKCGGCTMIDVPMEEQLKGKQAFVEECVGKFGKVDPIVRMKNPDHYRNKVTAMFGIDRGHRAVCGVYRARSHEIVPVKDCLIEDRRASAIVQTVFELLPSFKIKVYDERTGYGFLRAVQVRSARSTGEVMVTLVGTSPVLPSRNNFCRVLVEKHPEIRTIVLNINDQDTTMVLGKRDKVLYGPGFIEDVLLEKRFRISSRSFYQVNSLQTQKLYRMAIDAAGLSGKERVLDAYCGTGTIGICAAGSAKEVVGVELNEESIEQAVENAKANGVENISFYAQDAGDFMEEHALDREKFDVVIMDPPRSGASESFLESLLLYRPRRIVYVSCGPETLGRDLGVLTGGGYRAKRIMPVDMFPYTDSVEVVSLLQRVEQHPK